ncbi:MAG: hypothetical protein WAU68_07145 [Vitreimonas sp.]
MDWGLVQNDDGTFLPFPFSHPADVRAITPMLRFTVPPYRLWLQRIDLCDDNLRNTLDWVERVNTALFRRFDKLYDE